MSDVVDYALTSVVHDAYVLEPDGQRLPQSSSPTIIAAALRLLEVLPGTRILEVGTGSGYSTALLAHLVSSSGFVVSLDVDSTLVERASRLFAKHNLTHVKVVSGDGRDGYVSAAPFDRIIVWATADVLPHTWIEQLCPGGLVVAPVRLLQMADATAIVRVRTDLNKTPVGERVISGAFVRLTSEALSHWRGPSEDADIKTEASDQPTIWASAKWLQREKETGEAEQILQLMQTASPQHSPLHANEDVEALRAYLFATSPEGLTTAFTQALGPAIGYSQPRGLALLSLYERKYVAVGHHSAAAELSRWIEKWRAVGRPSFEQLRLVLEHTQHGYKVGVTE